MSDTRETCPACRGRGMVPHSDISTAFETCQACGGWGNRPVTPTPTALPRSGVMGPVVTPALRDVTAERQRQVEAEGWTAEHDDSHRQGELALAAACYAAPARIFTAEQRAGRAYGAFTLYHDAWPWQDRWWKPKDRRANLVRAGALILAEIERLDRAARSAPAVPTGVATTPQGETCAVCGGKRNA